MEELLRLTAGVARDPNYLDRTPRELAAARKTQSAQPTQRRSRSAYPHYDRSELAGEPPAWWLTGQFVPDLRGHHVRQTGQARLGDGHHLHGEIPERQYNLLFRDRRG